MSQRSTRNAATIALSLLLAASISPYFASSPAQAASPLACPTPTPHQSALASVRERMARTVRGPIAYYRFGRGRPLVLVTGLNATVAEWNAAFLTGLAAHHEVVLFDNRGVGRSQPVPADITARSMARDTAALIAALRLDHPTVLGWSMGGSVAARLAVDDPDAVGRLVLMSAPAPGASGAPTPLGAMRTLSGEAGAGFADVMALLFPAADTATAVRCFRTAMFRPRDYRDGPVSGRVVARQVALLREWATDETAASALRRLRVPTLILTGTEDEVVPVRNAEALHRLLPGSRLTLVAGGGHAMMYQQPTLLARRITTFTP